MASGRGTARGSVVCGIVAVAALPIAVYATRFSEGYELLHAGFAIPVAAGAGAMALALARRARRREAVRLASERGSGAARLGRVLGIVGLCMAASALVALGVYGVLEYAGTR